MYGVVQLLYHGVALAAVGNELVALQLQCVVLVNLVLHRGIADARSRGDEVPVLGGVGQIVLDELRQLQLGFLLHGIRTVRLRFAHVLPRQRTDVHHLVALLEALQLGLHTTQFAFDDEQALVDELGGVHRHLVFVVESLLVIDIDQRVEHVLGTQGGIVLERQDQDGRFVLFLPDSHAPLEAACHGIQRFLADMNITPRPRLSPTVGARNEDTLAADGKGIVQSHGICFIVGCRYSLEIGKLHLLLVLGSHGERNVPLRHHVDEGDIHRREVVKLVHAQALFQPVVHIGMQPLHHLAHQALGTKLENLVGHVHLINIVVITVEPRR